MQHQIHIDSFIMQRAEMPVLDVRTPAEFAHGHIPGAKSLPIFSNEERVQVGTTYHKEGREPAILLGFDLTGSKWAGFIRQALELAPGKKVILHCWRGGMRSGAMAWALSLYGFDVWVLEGGYKSYRKWAHKQFAVTRKLNVLGGSTGSGKTMLLQLLRQMDAQVLDLEQLAQHQGSTYGSMNRMQQPSQEQFENLMAEGLHNMDPESTLWVEDESLTIGKNAIPRGFWQQMQSAPYIEILVNREQRVANLVEEYGCLDKEFLEESTLRITKRLGPAETKEAVRAIREDRMADFIRLALVYYDKTYQKCHDKRLSTRLFELPLSGKCDARQADELLKFAASIL